MRSTRRSSLAAILLAAAVACSQAATENGTERYVGSYRAVSRPGTTLTVHEVGDQLEVVLQGGAAGDGSAADCHVRALGTPQGDHLEARFEAVDDDLFTYDAGDAQRENRRLVVTFDASGADVESVDTTGYCPLQTDFTGRYRRTEQGARAPASDHPT